MTVDRPALALAELSELTLLLDASVTLARLTARGCDIRFAADQWKPLAGGREYARSAAQPLRIDGLPADLVVEISRMSDDPDRAWVNGFELAPTGTDDSAWLDGIRDRLARGFQALETAESGIELYRRGTNEQCLLVTGPASQRPRLLLHRRDISRPPAGDVVMGVPLPVDPEIRS